MRRSRAPSLAERPIHRRDAGGVTRAARRPRPRRSVPPRCGLGQRAHHRATHRPSARLHHRRRARRGRRCAGSGSRDAVAAHPL